MNPSNGPPRDVIEKQKAAKLLKNTHAGLAKTSSSGSKKTSANTYPLPRHLGKKGAASNVKTTPRKEGNPPK